LMKPARLIICLIVLLGIVFGQDGYSKNWWPVDNVSPKSDPFSLISSNHGQPSGQFNWNSDQWQLMNRARRTCNGCTEGGKHVAIQNLTIFVNDQEFFVKAVCYVPVPLGTRTAGGRCSERADPYGNTYSACIGDFYYSNDSPGRNPPGPPDGWFTNLWHRDFPILQQAGANAIRLYYTSPITKIYTENVLNNITSVIPGEPHPISPANGYSHTTFLDLAYEYGLMVIYPLYGDQTGVTMYPPERVQGYIMAQIDEVGNHPAILMFTVGNEWPISTDDNLRNKLNQYIAFARNYTFTKWGRKIPITHAMNDDPFIYEAIYQELDVDVMSTNAGYRGEGFQDLWDGSQTPGFSGLGHLSTQYNKPNFISEIGWIQINGSDTATRPGWFNNKWKDLIQKGTPAGCVGGSFFEYMDEVYTKADPAQRSMGMVAPRVSSPSDMPPATYPSPSVTYPPYFKGKQVGVSPGNIVSTTSSEGQKSEPSSESSTITDEIMLPTQQHSGAGTIWFAVLLPLVILCTL